MDYSLDSWDFSAKYGRDYGQATGKEIRDAYSKYEDFYVKYHCNYPGTTTDCYAEFLETLGKQGKRHTFIGGEEFEYCYWFCAILQERQLGVTLQGAMGQSWIVETLWVHRAVMERE